jgi:O-antigen/teichoic acid export membrane protein
LAYFIAKSPEQARGIAHLVARLAIPQVAALMMIHALALAILVYGKPHSVVLAAEISLLAVPATMALEYGLAILQGLRRFLAFNLLRLLPFATYSVVLAVFFVASIGDLPVVAALTFGSSLILGAITLLYAASTLPAATPALAVGKREIIGFGTRAFLGALSPVDAFRLDQLFVGLALSPVQLGVYVVGAAFSNLPRFVAQSVGMVAYPQIASEPSRRVAMHAVWRFFAVGLVLCGGIVLILELIVGRLIPLLFGSAFSDARSVAQILLVGSLFLSLRRVLTDGIRGAGYPLVGAIAEVFALLTLPPTLALLVPPWGTEGVAMAFATSAALGLAVSLFLALFLTRRSQQVTLAPALTGAVPYDG